MTDPPFPAWRPIAEAPRGKYETRTFMREGKEIRIDEFVAPYLLLLLDGKHYLTKQLASGRFNGMSEKDKPSHFILVPSPSEAA